MERESFEDSEVANLLNMHFVSIKVDKEERPDIDSVYMQACQMATGGGGWPLTVLMNHERKPFFVGTYFPKMSFGRQLGLIEILKQISNIWKNNRTLISDAQTEMLDTLEKDVHHSGRMVSVEAVSTAVSSLVHSFDPVYGGFGDSPKFPSPHNIMFLFRAFHEYCDNAAKEVALKTLDGMALGGIYDHIGYGFCRYSTDRMWLAPHFEKMLYDNALLTMAYCEAFLVSGYDKYKKTADAILTYVLRDMTDDAGGFYSAEDADSEGEEGKFYIWDKKEILSILGNTDGERFCHIYNVTEKGNFESKNILNLIAKPISQSDGEFVEGCRKILFAAREKRVHPLKDKKILASWNGLMIAAFATAGRVFRNDEYIKAAQKSASFIFDRLYNKNTLYTRYCDGEVLKKSFAADYAYVIWGLIELYQTTFETEYLIKALDLNNRLLEDFCDEKNPGVFLYPKNEENILIRPKEIYDGAVPSSNSVTVYNLIRLSRITGNSEYERTAIEILSGFAEEIEAQPAAYTFSLISVLYLSGKSQEVVITADSTDMKLEAVSYLNSKFLPFLCKMLLTPETAEIKKIASYLSDYRLPARGWSAYICRNNACLPSVDSLDELEKML